VNGCAIYFETAGDRRKPCVLFSNSLGTDCSMWDAQAEALASGYFVVRYDTRGHGRSSSPPGPYTVAQLGGDVVALLDHLDVEKAHVCGLSMGGVTAQWLGVHAPRRVLKLVLANTAARVGTRDAWLERAATVRGKGLASIAASSASRWFTPAWAAANGAVAGNMAGILGRQDAEGYAACCEALAFADLRADLATISIPTLVITGRHDPVTTVADGEALCASIRGAQLAVLNASHISNVEDPAGFTSALRNFL
jgi:3-oxoadipate enol-lactonase